MGDWGYVFNHVDLKPCGLQRADCGFPPGAGPLDVHFHLFEPVLHCGFCGSFSRRLRGKRGGFAGTAESELARACP